MLVFNSQGQLSWASFSYLGQKNNNKNITERNKTSSENHLARMDAALFAIVYNTAAEALHGLQQQQPNSTLYSFDVLEAITYHLSRVPKRGVSSKRVVPT